LSDQLDYRERNHIEKRFRTATMPIDCFHSYWQGSRSSARLWLRRFRYNYNHQGPNRALDGRTPAEGVQNQAVPDEQYFNPNHRLWRLRSLRTPIRCLQSPS
jgi:hypothetical protein